MYNSDLLYTGADVRLDPFVRTDLAGGPVVIGPGCMMIFPGTVLPGHLPVCLWFIGYSLAEGEPLSSLLSTCGVVVERQGAFFAEVYRDLFRPLDEMTAGERTEEVRKWKDQRKSN